MWIDMHLLTVLYKWCLKGLQIAKSVMLIARTILPIARTRHHLHDVQLINTDSLLHVTVKISYSKFHLCTYFSDYSITKSKPALLEGPLNQRNARIVWHDCVSCQHMLEGNTISG